MTIAKSIASIAIAAAAVISLSIAAVAAPPLTHHHHAHARRHIRHLQAAYARAKANGHYGAARRIHAKAMAVRHHTHMMHGH